MHTSDSLIKPKVHAKTTKTDFEWQSVNGSFCSFSQHCPSFQHFVSNGTMKDGWLNLACHKTASTWPLTNNCTDTIPEILLKG